MQDIIRRGRRLFLRWVFNGMAEEVENLVGSSGVAHSEIHVRYKLQRNSWNVRLDGISKKIQVPLPSDLLC